MKKNDYFTKKSEYIKVLEYNVKYCSQVATMGY